MDSGATVGGTRERAASSGKGHVEGKFSRARPRGYRVLSLSLYRLGRIILDIIIYYFAACGRNTFFERIFFEEYIVVINY